MVGGEIDDITASVDVYDIAKGAWLEGPALNEARYCNSSCQQGDFVFTFGGYDANDDRISSIEFLNAKKYLIEGDKN